MIEPLRVRKTRASGIKLHIAPTIAGLWNVALNVSKRRHGTSEGAQVVLVVHGSILPVVVQHRRHDGPCATLDNGLMEGESLFLRDRQHRLIPHQEPEPAVL
jgi:hypothetical protein